MLDPLAGGEHADGVRRSALEDSRGRMPPTLARSIVPRPRRGARLRSIVLGLLGPQVVRRGLRSVPPVTTDIREARTHDADTLLAFMRWFNESQGYPFDEESARQTVLELLGSASLGRIWLIVADGSSVGYLVLTFGYSLEYGGRDAFVDELFVEPSARGRGLARDALSFALSEASRLGVHAVHLEVERNNSSAHALYESLGFVGNDRQLLTHRVARRLTRQSS